MSTIYESINEGFKKKYGDVKDPDFYQSPGVKLNESIEKPSSSGSKFTQHLNEASKFTKASRKAVSSSSTNLIVRYYEDNVHTIGVTPLDGAPTYIQVYPDGSSVEGLKKQGITAEEKSGKAGKWWKDLDNSFRKEIQEKGQNGGTSTLDTETFLKDISKRTKNTLGRRFDVEDAALSTVKSTTKKAPKQEPEEPKPEGAPNGEREGEVAETPEKEKVGRTDKLTGGNKPNEANVRKAREVIEKEIAGGHKPRLSTITTTFAVVMNISEEEAFEIMKQAMKELHSELTDEDFTNDMFITGAKIPGKKVKTSAPVESPTETAAESYHYYKESRNLLWGRRSSHTHINIRGEK